MIEIRELDSHADPARSGLFVEIDIADAYRLITSLITQIAKRSTNLGRGEFETRDGRYFSIAVRPDPIHDAVARTEKLLIELELEFHLGRRDGDSSRVKNILAALLGAAPDAETK